MSFALTTQTGVEQGATQVLFDFPPRIEDPYAEGSVDTVFDVAVAGNPVACQYSRSQAKAFLQISVAHLTAAKVATLETLADAGGVVVVKVDPTSAATVTCVWGPRSEQKIEPIVGKEPPIADEAGQALDSGLTDRRATLLFLRME